MKFKADRQVAKKRQKDQIKKPDHKRKGDEPRHGGMPGGGPEFMKHKRPPLLIKRLDRGQGNIEPGVVKQPFPGAVPGNKQDELKGVDDPMRGLDRRLIKSKQPGDKTG